jgi:hypothetical protein
MGATGIFLPAGLVTNGAVGLPLSGEGQSRRGSK